MAKKVEYKKSSSDSNSTGDESAMASNLTAGADQRLDTQLDHVLAEFLSAKGGNYEIRQMFKECNVYQFEDFVKWELEHIKEMKRKQHTTTKVLITGKVRRSTT